MRLDKTTKTQLLEDPRLYPALIKVAPTCSRHQCKLSLAITARWHDDAQEYATTAKGYWCNYCARSAVTTDSVLVPISPQDIEAALAEIDAHAQDLPVELDKFTLDALARSHELRPYLERMPIMCPICGRPMYWMHEEAPYFVCDAHIGRKVVVPTENYLRAVVTFAIQIAGKDIVLRTEKK